MGGNIGIMEKWKLLLRVYGFGVKGFRVWA